MSIEDDIAIIERAPTLRALGRTALRILAIGAESRQLGEGEVLFSTGDAADCAFVVQEGSFQLKSDAKSLGEVIADPGTLLGELALVVQTTRPATAIAREPSTVIRISRSLFLKMLESYPEAAEILRDQILARAQQSIAEISDVSGMLGVRKTPR